MDDNPAGGNWSPTKANTLDSLLALAGSGKDDRSRDGTPWGKGHELVYQGIGGIHVMGDRHVAVAADSYTTYMTGDRKVDVRGDMVLTAERAASVVEAPDTGVSEDKLVVQGNMTSSFPDRITMGLGDINRRWTGTVLRIAGMEGVICGGSLSRQYFGGSATGSALQMRDVYGGAIRSSMLRIGFTLGVGYRSTDYGNWHMATYRRMSRVTIEPMIGSPKEVPTAFWRNADIASKIAFSILPILGILYGFGMLLYAAAGLALAGLMGLLGMISPALAAKLARHKNAPPTAPRVRERKVLASHTAVRSSETTT